MRTGSRIVPYGRNTGPLNADKIRRQMTQFFEATSDAIAFLDHNYVFTFMNRRAR